MKSEKTYEAWKQKHREIEVGDEFADTPNIDSIASDLNVSRRTLQRQIAGTHQIDRYPLEDLAHSTFVKEGPEDIIGSVLIDDRRHHTAAEVDSARCHQREGDVPGNRPQLAFEDRNRLPACRIDRGSTDDLGRIEPRSVRIRQVCVNPREGGTRNQSLPTDVTEFRRELFHEVEIEFSSWGETRVAGFSRKGPAVRGQAGDTEARTHGYDRAVSSRVRPAFVQTVNLLGGEPMHSHRRGLDIIDERHFFGARCQSYLFSTHRPGEIRQPDHTL